MQTLEPSTTFGQLDKTFLGLWLNADPIVRSAHPERALPLFWRSLYLPLSDDHRAFVAASAPGSERGLAAAAFTAATHESRHFHDLLFSTYGSMMARQHVRAALLVRACLNQMLFRSRMMIVPLDAWRDYWQTLHVADARVEPPPPALADLGDTLRIMRTKLDAFDKGVFCPAQLKITATGILEAIAGTVQARTIHLEFGQEASTDFLNLMRETGAYGRYYGVLDRMLGALGPMPTEAMLLLLEASLCGNFQDPREEVPRYPADLLLAMLAWLERNHIRPGRLATFGDLYAKVDDFFDHQFGDDLQGIVIRAGKLNWEQALPAFRKIAKAISGTGTSEADRGAAAAVDAFESFTRTGAALGGNVCQDPSWFCGEHYFRVWNHLPRPLVLVGANYAIPITPDLERAFDIHQAAEFVLHDKAAGRITALPPQLLDLLPADSARFALLVSMRPALVRGLSHDVELPVATQLVMPPIDLQAWVEHYEGTTALLRFLVEGEESAQTALDQRLILSIFSLVGTDIYGLAGRLDMPSAADALAGVVRDPYLDRKYADPEFLKLLATLRSEKGRAPETVEVDPPRAHPPGDLGSRYGAQDERAIPPDEQFDLGMGLAQLDPPELREARHWLTAAAEAGHTEAQYRLGLLLASVLDPPEPKEARRWWTAAAKVGHTDAQYCLGLLLETRPDPPEPGEARRWYTAAAHSGQVQAQNALAVLLATECDPPEPGEARQWWTAAAEAGDHDAQYNLGLLLSGSLDPLELAEARRWFERAASSGDLRAIEALQRLRRASTAGRPTQPDAGKRTRRAIGHLRGFRPR